MSGLRAPPPGTLRAAMGFAAAIAAAAMVPAIGFAATFAWLHAADHRCSAPIELRGSIAPEADLAKLETPGDRP